MVAVVIDGMKKEESVVRGDSLCQIGLKSSGDMTWWRTREDFFSRSRSLGLNCQRFNGDDDDDFNDLF